MGVVKGGLEDLHESLWPQKFYDDMVFTAREKIPEK